MLRCHDMDLLEDAHRQGSFGDFLGCDRNGFLFFRTEWLEGVR